MSPVNHQDGNDTKPYAIPKESCRWQALALAALVHAALLGFLWFGAQSQYDDSAVNNVESGNPNQPHRPHTPMKTVLNQQQYVEPVRTIAKALPTTAPEPLRRHAASTRQESALREQAKPSRAKGRRTNELRETERKRRAHDMFIERKKQQDVMKQRELAEKEKQTKMLLAKKAAAAQEKEKAVALAKRVLIEQSKKEDAKKKMQQELAEEKRLDQFRAAEMRRITSQSIEAGTNRNPPKRPEAKGWSG